MRVKRVSVSDKLLGQACPTVRRVWQTIKRLGLLKPRDSLLLGVSGGPDSVAMLLLLKSINEQYHQHWRLKIAHLNHLIRGKESDRDEAFVRNLVRQLDLPVYIERVNIPALKGKAGSVEGIARDERYQFFNRVAKKNNIKKVAVGHTQDDQAETVLLRILRGCGLRGLRGILPQRPVLTGSKITLIRPLLEVKRSELERFLKEQAQAVRFDSSNLNQTILRNRVRLKLLPYLSRYNKGVKNNLAQLARAGQEAHDFLEGEAKRVSASLNGSKLKVSLLKKLPPALQIALLDESVKKVKKNLSGMTSEHYQAMLSLLTADGRSRRIDLPGRLMVTRSYDTLRFGLSNGQAKHKKVAPAKVTIPGQNRLAKYGLVMTSRKVPRSSYKKVKSSFPACRAGWEETLDLDRITQPLSIRYRQPGDRFHPLGMKGTQSLKKFFINSKTPPAERGAVPLLVANGQIIWAMGHRIDERVKVTDQTKRVLRVKAEPLKGKYIHG